LTGNYNNNTLGCFDIQIFKIVHDRNVCKKSDLASVLLSQLWGANCVTIETANQLTSQSLCLQYIPSDARSQFLSLVTSEVKRATEAASLAYGKENIDNNTFTLTDTMLYDEHMIIYLIAVAKHSQYTRSLSYASFYSSSA
jgi:hypothetical protein